VAAEVAIAAEQDITLPLDVSFEHGVLALSDGLTVDGTSVSRGSMVVFDAGRVAVRLTTSGPGQALLIGGTPFEEELVMWWNFVGRSHDEIVQVRQDWEAGRGFGEVHGYAGDRLAAPPMPGTRLRPRPRTRST
jgi:redox-sensitive bicupin YhaK (pirin superfamily)